MTITYKTSGVDISKGNRLVDIIRPLAKSTAAPGVLNDIGSFGAFYRLKSDFRNPVLVSSTDGVGTKLKIAFMMNRHNTVGIDLVAMCVNDILTCGAAPLFFLDYFATGKLSLKKAADVIGGIAEGCRIAGCSLIGGETAEMPGFYTEGEYDIAGFAVGMVERRAIVDGKRIRRGDLIIGLPSEGLHSNGYSLARRLFFEIKQYKTKMRIKELDTSIGEALIHPTRIYVKSILRILGSCRIKGMAHITGGGLTENVPRMLPRGKGLKAVIEKGSWPSQKLFTFIQNEGNIPEAEMFRTFNMGIGYVLVAGRTEATSILKKLKRMREEAHIIGYIEKGRGGVTYVS